MSDASPRQLARRLFEAVDAHALDRAARCHAGDYVGLDLSRRQRRRGPAEARAAWAAWCDAFPDLRLTVHDVVADGDRVVVLWTLAGTHRGPLLSIPPTGRAVAVDGVTRLVVRRGRAVRGLHLWDEAGLLRDLHLLPARPDAPPDHDALLGPTLAADGAP